MEDLGALSQREAGLGINFIQILGGVVLTEVVEKRISLQWEIQRCFHPGLR